MYTLKLHVSGNVCKVLPSAATCETFTLSSNRATERDHITMSLITALEELDSKMALGLMNWTANDCPDMTGKVDSEKDNHSLSLLRSTCPRIRPGQGRMTFGHSCSTAGGTYEVAHL